MTSTLTGFTGDEITPVGVVTLPMTSDNEPRTKTLIVPFMMVELPSAYNVSIGRPTLNKLRAVVCTYHCSMKFPTSNGAGEIRNDPRESRRYYLAAITIPKKGKKEPLAPDPQEPSKPNTRPEPIEPILEVPLEKDLQTMRWDLVESSLGDSPKGSGSSLGTRREIVGKKTRGLATRMPEAAGLCES
ncbi:hypothetical protein BHE74_00042157 [Ensete ventricosum]|nr:hypothetical protein BHE74_00042157 [Ensete ventricosum]